MARTTGTGVPSVFSMNAVGTDAATDTISLSGDTSARISSSTSRTFWGLTETSSTSASRAAARLSVPTGIASCSESRRARSACRTVPRTRLGDRPALSSPWSRIAPIFPVPRSAIRRSPSRCSMVVEAMGDLTEKRDSWRATLDPSAGSGSTGAARSPAPRGAAPTRDRSPPRGPPRLRRRSARAAPARRCAARLPARPPPLGAGPVRQRRPAGAVEHAPRPARIEARTPDELGTPAQQHGRPEQLRRLGSAAPRGLGETRPVEGIDDGAPDGGALLVHVKGFVAADWGGGDGDVGEQARRLRRFAGQVARDVHGAGAQRQQARVCVREEPEREEAQPRPVPPVFIETLDREVVAPGVFDESERPRADGARRAVRSRRHYAPVGVGELLDQASSRARRRDVEGGGVDDAHGRLADPHGAAAGTGDAPHRPHYRRSRQRGAVVHPHALAQMEPPRVT